MPSNIDMLTKIMEGPADKETIMQTLETAQSIVDGTIEAQEESALEDPTSGTAMDMKAFYDSLPRKTKRSINPKNSFSNRFKASINRKK